MDDDDDNDWNDDDNKDLDDDDNKDNDTDADNGDGGGSFLRCSVDPETLPYGGTTLYPTRRVWWWWALEIYQDHTNT